MGGYIGGNGGVTQVDGYNKTEVDSKVSDKVDHNQVLTDVPASAVFTDTTYSVQDGELSQNNFTDADHTKLDGIEAGATADQTDAEIKTAYENNSNTNAFTDADHTKLNSIETNADVTDTTNVVAALTAGTNVAIAANGTISSTDTNTTYSVGDNGLTQRNFTNAFKAKLEGIESGATADQTKTDIDALNINADTLDGQHGSYYTGYTDTAVSNIVNSAPGTLDTLNELAAALGDDANFSTTVTNSIATKLPKAGGTMTGVLSISGVAPIMKLAETGVTNNPVWWHVGDGGNYSIRLNNTGSYPLSIITNSTNNAVDYIDMNYNTNFGAGIDVTGNIAVSGTVDGRDVSEDGTKLDGIESNAKNDQTITAGSGLSGGGTGNVTLSHSDTSSQSSVNNSGRTYIQDITLDTYGHITGISSATETVVNTDTNTTYSADGNYGMTLSGTAFRLENDRRRNSTGEDVWSGNTHDYTFYDSSHGIRWYTAGAEEMRLENDGDLHVDGNVVAYSTTVSDERLKKDIVKIYNALDKVSQLNGYTFEYLADGKKSAGVIAQEVEKVMPSAITESTLPLKMGDEDENMYKTVQYDQLTGLLIEAIKELKAEIDVLKGD